MISREQVYAALFAYAQAIGPSPGTGAFVTVSRRLQFAERMQPEQMPALFQQQDNEGKYEYTMDEGPEYGNLHVNWYVYVANPTDESIATSTGLNAAEDAAIAAVPIEMSVGTGADQQNVAVRIGAPMIWEGVLDGVAVCKIPLTIKPL